MLVTDEVSISVIAAVVVGAALASAVTIAATYPVMKRRILDAPSARSSHRTPVPRGGGVGVIAGVMAGCAIAASQGFTTPGYLLVAVLFISGVGLADDVRSQSALLRMTLTLACAVGFAVSLLHPRDMTGWIVLLSAVVLLAGYTNAFNFMDGINGISALSAAVAGAWFAVLANEYELGSALGLAVSVTSASLAFLPWNFPVAAVFLGDVGSYGLGFALSALALLCWHGGAPALMCAAPFVVYVVDTTVAVMRRTLQRKRWSEAHREHIYQRLFDDGMSHLSVSTLVASMALLSCAGIWLIERYSDAPTAGGLLLLVAVAGGYLAMPRVLKQSDQSRA